MSSIPLEIEINGPVQAVFDLVTQARFWPEWHVLTRAVTGTTQRPFRPGDKFTEFIRTPEGTQELTWHVVDFEEGKRVTIGQEGNPNTISYRFSATPNGTLFSRTVDSPEGSQVKSAAASRAAVTHDTETHSINALKALVERILANEQKGPYYPPR